MLWLRRWTAASALVLLACTWRLWLPQTVFPQVPLVRWAGLAPVWLEVLLAVLLLAALAGALFLPDAHCWSTASLIAVVGGFIGLSLIDQHRLQPWAYQFVLIALVLACCEAQHACRLLRILTISIYFYSALSKVDFTFLHALGQQLAGGLFKMLGVSIEAWAPHWRVAAAAMFPLAELLIAIGLAFSKLRRPALLAAVAMHLLLLIVLGPWGLGHSLGVLVWNIFFIGQDVLLFAGKNEQQLTSADVQPPPDSIAGRKLPNRASWLAEAAILIAIIWPCLAPWGLCDDWLAWAVYAPAGDGVKLFVHGRDRERLPQRLQRYLVADGSDDAWLEFRLGGWSLDELGAPIYPAARFDWAVAASLVREYNLENARLAHFSRANRWNGKRSAETVAGFPNIVGQHTAFWLNSRPRRLGF
jgi:hypothetical protein